MQHDLTQQRRPESSTLVRESDAPVDRLIDMDVKKPVICGQDLSDHLFKMEGDFRSLTCERCGYGFRIQPHTTREEDGYLVVESGTGDLRIPMSA